MTHDCRGGMQLTVKGNLDMLEVTQIWPLADIEHYDSLTHSRV